MEQVEVMLMKFGDDQSTLFDQYERLSVEIQLNQAILKRSLSEPTQTRSQAAAVLVCHQGPPQEPPASLQPAPLVGKKRTCSGFHKVLKKMIRPIIGRMRYVKKKEVSNEQAEPRLWKAFSRSLRM